MRVQNHSRGRVQMRAVLSVCIVLLAMALAEARAGLVTLNLHNLAVLRLVSQQDDHRPATRSLDTRWLLAAARHGSRAAVAQMRYVHDVEQALGETDTYDPVPALAAWYWRRAGHGVTESAWPLLLGVPTRLQAEDMGVGGVATPNPYVDVRVADDRSVVVLFWQHNDIHASLPLAAADRYRVTVCALDSPPGPLTLQLWWAGEERRLQWTEADWQWRVRSTEFDNPGGLVLLRLRLSVRSGDSPSQDAWIDYVDVEPLGRQAAVSVSPVVFRH